MDILLDRRRLARVEPEERGQTGLVHQISSEFRDGHLHEVRLRRTGGGEIADIATLWEPRRADAPARSFLLEQEPEAPSRRDRAVPLRQDGWLKFDQRSFNMLYAGWGDQLVQNREHIGGLAAHRRYRPWPAYLAMFRDHHVDPLFGGVYRPQGAMWQGSTYLANSFAQGITRQQIRQGDLAEPPAERCFLLCNSVKDTFFHWHLDCLAGLVLARDQMSGAFQTLAPPELKPWQSASLELLGEEVKPMAKACRPRETLVASHLDGRGIYPDRFVVKMFGRLKRAQVAKRRFARKRGAGPKIFVSRRDAGHRVLENEAELWSALQPRGFERFIPGEASYAEQIEAFAAAEVVVASHGSALTSIGFCRPRTQIVEILPSDYLNGCFRYLAIAMGLRHGWYATDLTSPFRVDVEDFMRWCAEHRLF